MPHLRKLQEKIWTSVGYETAPSDIVLKGAVDFCSLDPNLYPAGACNNQRPRFG